MGRSKKPDSQRIARALQLLEFFEKLESKAETREWAELHIMFSAGGSGPYWHSTHIRYGNGQHHLDHGFHREPIYSLLASATGEPEWTQGYIFPIDERVDIERDFP